MARTTTRRGHQRKSPEQRQAERRRCWSGWGRRSRRWADSAEWIAYLQFMSAFRRYSFNNLMLIALQCPHATHVAGFRKWQQLGRQVRKGEKAIKILGYSTKKVTKTDPATGEEVEDRVTRFPVLSVFDVSQTDGDPVPSNRLRAADGGGARRDAGPAHPTGSSGEGWSVRELPLAGTMEGYTDHRRHIIATEANLEPAARLMVLLHETAHALLHEDDAEYVAHRGVCETEAESTAYVLAGLIGMDADASSVSYVAGWASADRDVITAAATNVLRAVNTIAAALGLDEDDTDEDDADTNTASTGEEVHAA